MRIRLYILGILSFWAFSPQGWGQRAVPAKSPNDTIPSHLVSRDSLTSVQEIHVRISPDSLDAKVDYGSADSNYLDNASRRVYLYGKAYVKYKDLSLNADFIIVDLDSSIATAEGLPDSLGKLAGIPEFKMSGQEPIKAERMRYNFRTRRGLIYEALTTQRDLFIHGEKTKFVSNGDTLNRDDVLYGTRALITTCDAPHPHFGIRATKIKTIPDKLAVIGPSNLELFGVPTPVWLPFGFYPVSSTRRAGIIFPRDYERSPQQGFGLREVGYYFPVGEKIDFKILGDIYFNGTWGLGVVSNYVQKYQYRGTVDIRYSRRISEPANDYRKNVEKSFSIRVSHTQDPKSNPNQTIGGSINIQSNDYESLNYNDAQSALTNTYSSNFNYSRKFPGKPYSLSAGMNHSQNTRTHIVTINAPELNFRLDRIYPFKRARRTGPEQWYEKIAFQYAGSGRSQVIGTDTTLFDTTTWQNFQYGMQHKASANVNFNVLKYFNFTPSIDYGETWFFKTQDRIFRFDPTDMDFVRNDTVYYPDSSGYFILPDTVSYGKVDMDLKPGFEAFRTMSASISMNTQLFGTIQFKKGWLRGIRHVIKPSIGLSFSPKSPSAYYQQLPFSVQYPDSSKRYSRFDGLLYSVRPTDVKQANINYSLTNLFEAKYWSRRDSTEKKLKLFDNINISGSYNMALKKNQNPWSPINISGNTRLWKGLTTISVGATYSVYALKSDGRLDTKSYYDATGHLLRFDNLRLRFSTRLSFEDIKSIFTRKAAQTNTEEQKSSGASKKLPSGDLFLDLLSNFTISHELGLLRMGRTGKDTTITTTHTVNMIGSMRLTPNWHIRFGNIGYDFRSKQLTYPDIGLVRDLHCWQLSFNFQPDRGTYSFNIGVKPGTFDFLKFPYRRGNYDVLGDF